jgi:hypothetical protein
MARDKTDKTDKSPDAILERWGIPDWRYADPYLNMAAWDMDRWRWEFLRRRADYRADFEAASIAVEPASPDFSGEQPDNGLWLIGDGMRVWPFPHRRAENYGLMEFYDPKISDWMSMGPSWNSGVIYGPSHGVRDIVTEGWGFEEVVDSNLVSFTFDLSKPLAPQLSEVKAELEMSQSLMRLTLLEQVELAYGPAYAETEETPLDELLDKLNKKLRAPKHHVEKWPSYLRALDAREIGASWSEIADIFFQDGFLDRRKAPDGGYGAPPPQAARELWLQADALRF